MDDEQRYTAMTFGPGSYMVNGLFETGSWGEHVLVGRYSALGRRLTFELGLNHDYRQVTTYPFEDFVDGGVPWTNHYGHVNRKQIIIGNDVWIGCDVTILGGVRIGNGAVIGAGALVAKDVPPYAVVVGNPARIVKYRFDEETIRALQEIKWWNWPEEKIKANLLLMKDPTRFVAEFSVSHEDEPKDDILDRMRELREAGYCLYYFVPDFTSGEAVWRHVIDSYLEMYCASDKAALFLHRSGLMQQEEQWAQISVRLEERGADAPMLLAYDTREVFSIPVLREADVFITTKEDVSSQCVDYAADVGTVIRYGMDHETILFASDRGYAGDLRSQGIIKKGNGATKGSVCSAAVLSIPADLQCTYKKDKLECEIADYKARIRASVQGGQTENAMAGIRYIADVLYDYNQTYADMELEDALRRLRSLLSVREPAYEHSARQRIVFYDAFGFETRGLAAIYLRALSKMDADILYVTNAEAQGRISRLEEILSECHAQICYLEVPDTHTRRYELLCERMAAFRPTAGFLYTTPYDVSGILAFMRFEGAMKRYQINLTDHAFWLGVNAFDVCLEFRDFGAAVSRDHRGIAPDKLRKQPYYPIVDRNEPFAGYPVERTENDFIIFTGGFLYKSIDPEKTYYRLVGSVLAAFPQTKLWYAGYGDDTYLKELMAAYPGRVFHTEERPDLFQLLRHVDMYLNTSPQMGGLMTQYAALAGRPPFLLDPYADAAGLLLHEEELGVFFTNFEECRAALHRFVRDPAYRKELEERLKKYQLIITEDEFNENLEEILTRGTSRYPSRFPKIDMRFHDDLYRWRFIKNLPD